MYTCPAGKLTIGYGHVVFADADKFKYKDGISEFEANKLLIEDCKLVETFINKNIKVDYQGEFDALVSLIYNIGIDRFKKSKAYELLKKGDYGGAAFQMFDEKTGFVKVDTKTLPGLVKRRQEEFNLWFRDYDRVAP
jgi:lysozyme